MTATPTNQVPYLRTTRTFPQDPQSLSVEMSKAYLDIANVVNSRTIGIFGTVQTVTGNAWYLKGGTQRNQTLRQVYSFTSTGSIPHGINTLNIVGFVAIYGSFQDNATPPNFYPLPYVSTTAANQVQVVITPTNIVITAGGGAPTIVNGVIVLEWLSQV